MVNEYDYNHGIPEYDNLKKLMISHGYPEELVNRALSIKVTSNPTASEQTVMIRPSLDDVVLGWENEITHSFTKANIMSIERAQQSSHQIKADSDGAILVEVEYGNKTTLSIIDHFIKKEEIPNFNILNNDYNISEPKSYPISIVSNGVENVLEPSYLFRLNVFYRIHLENLLPVKSVCVYIPFRSTWFEKIDSTAEYRWAKEHGIEQVTFGRHIGSSELDDTYVINDENEKTVRTLEKTPNVFRFVLTPAFKNYDDYPTLNYPTNRLYDSQSAVEIPLDKSAQNNNRFYGKLYTRVQVNYHHKQSGDLISPYVFSIDPRKYYLTSEETKERKNELVKISIDRNSGGDYYKENPIRNLNKVFNGPDKKPYEYFVIVGQIGDTYLDPFGGRSELFIKKWIDHGRIDLICFPNLVFHQGKLGSSFNLKCAKDINQKYISYLPKDISVYPDKYGVSVSNLKQLTENKYDSMNVFTHINFTTNNTFDPKTGLSEAGIVLLKTLFEMPDFEVKYTTIGDVIIKDKMTTIPVEVSIVRENKDSAMLLGNVKLHNEISYFAFITHHAV